MTNKYHVVADVKLRLSKPTRLAFEDLYTWTIWQFPRRKTGGLMGAVRPPIAEHGWYPAIIQTKEKQALVHAHLDQVFDSPEDAVEHLNKVKL
jgi:hypothetical protein